MLLLWNFALVLVLPYFSFLSAISIEVILTLLLSIIAICYIEDHESIFLSRQYPILQNTRLRTLQRGLWDIFLPEISYYIFIGNKI